MAVRALIVAIEDYPKVSAGGLAKKLDGTLEAGLAFKKWLTEKWARQGVRTTDQHLIMCTEPKQPDGYGATSGDIRKALLELKKMGAAQTEELYVFLSGHGFNFIRQVGEKTTMLIGSEFESPDLSGSACLSVGYLRTWLSAHLGPGRQTYFVNLCRNNLDVGMVAAPEQFLPYKPQVTGEGSTFVIYAASEGDVTQVNSKFNQHLFDGLKGQGRAKVWDEKGAKVMHVRYSSLKEHLASRLGRLVDGGALGPYTDMNYETFDPPPKTSCTIRIKGTAEIKGTVEFLTNRDDRPKKKRLAGATTVLQLRPDIYRFSVKTDAGTVKPAVSKVIDLYDEATVKFTIEPEEFMIRGGLESLKDAKLYYRYDGDTSSRRAPGSPPIGVGRGSPALPIKRRLQAAGNATLRLVLPPGCQLDLTNSGFPRKTMTFDGSQSVRVNADRYIAVLRQDKVQIERQEFDLKAGERREIAMGRWQESRPHAAIALALGTPSDEVFFAESLGGPVVDTGLDLWLALVGAGRIFLGGPEADYHKFEKLPLKDFRKLKRDSSPIYVLAGSPVDLPSLEVAVSEGAEVRWRKAESPDGMQGVYQAFFDVKEGSHLLSFRIGSKPAYTVATCASPNRTTLVTIVLDAQGAATVSQFLLPIARFADRLPEYPKIEERRLTSEPLVDVQFLVRAMRDFRDRRTVFDADMLETFERLLYAKWLDPITSALFSYEMLRRGKAEELNQVVENMKKYFTIIPDSAALDLLHKKRSGKAPKGVPLFLDGLRAYPDFTEWLPLPASHLDFSNPWTAWWDAIGRDDRR